jgi:hypothetical protein
MRTDEARPLSVKNRRAANLCWRSATTNFNSTTTPTPTTATTTHPDDYGGDDAPTRYSLLTERAM